LQASCNILSSGGDEANREEKETTMTLNEAIQNREAARAQFNAATTRKARIQAEEDLNFWQGKVAMLAVMAERGL
jgi:hypothetical protein